MVPGHGKDKTSQAGFADGLAQGAHTDRTWTFATLKEIIERVFPPGKTLSDMPACPCNTSKEVFKVKDLDNVEQCPCLVGHGPRGKTITMTKSKHKNK